MDERRLNSLSDAEREYVYRLCQDVCAGDEYMEEEPIQAFVKSENGYGFEERRALLSFIERMRLASRK